MFQKIIILGLLSVGLLSCAADDSNTDQTAKEAKSKPKEHMLSDHQRLLDKAKEGEKQIKAADEKRRKALDDEGG